jgi:NAD(P)-dependent dehydrogenase (short-subunit alcohol dehydrogenase family)
MVMVLGRVALVTGGAQGIGRSIALRLAHDGAAVAIFDRNRVAAEATAAEIRTLGRDATAFVGDVANPSDVEAAIKAIESDFGPIAVLINNAGICRIAPAFEMSLEDFRETFRVNVEGVFIFCREVVPLMMNRRKGVIINMSSTAGKSGRPYRAAYSASKFAIIGFTQSLAGEVAHLGIRVNAICPGIVVETDMRREIEAAHRHYGLPETRDREKAIPIGRAGQPEDVARVAAFLASDESAYITGEALSVSGGL